MTRISHFRPTERFSGLAEIYARYRPSYPNEAVDHILKCCDLRRESLMVDVGAGTGIASRLFAARGLRVVGIEPNADMRTTAQAEENAPHAPWPTVTYREGRAEETGLPDRLADAVLAAQAFHWFEPEAALREFHRILKAGGWVVLIWNERDETDPFTAAYGAVIRTCPEATAVEMPRSKAGDALLTSALFQHGRRTIFRNEQCLDVEGLLGRAFSVSYAPKDTAAAEVYAAALRQVFHRFQKDGEVTLKYETTAFLAQRS